MIKLILKILRILYVHNRVLRKDYKFESNMQKFTLSGGSFVFMRRGGSLAKYAGRFVLISANDFTQILMGNVCDEANLLEKYPTLGNKDNINKYIVEYNRFVRDFYKNYKEKENQNISAIRTINEEFSHHKLIRETPTFIILNSLTIYYRICSCYLTYYRYYNKKMDIKVSEALLNTYLIRSYIAKITFPIVEASYHYHENLSDLKEKYGDEVKKWCEKFLEIENALNEKNVDKEYLSRILILIQRVFLSFFYIETIVNYTKIDLMKFIQFCEVHYVKKNEEIYNNIIKEITSADFNKVTFEIFLETEKKNRMSNTQLDQELRASLMFLATETSKNFIPNSLFSFIFKRLVFCKNKLVFLTILTKKKKEVDDSYKEYPPIKCVGFKNFSWCIDGPMENFKGKTFIIAQNSFEPTLVGENGYINIVDSPICSTLLIHALLIKTLSLLFFNIENEQFDEIKFKQEFSQVLSNMPDNHKEWIKDYLLDLFYEKSKRILRGCNGISGIDIKEIAVRFENSIIELKKEIDSYDNKKRKSFYRFCDVNYVHGF